MFDIVERKDVSRCGKIKSTGANRHTLGALTSFLVQSGKVINYDKALVFSLSSIPLYIADVDDSRLKKKKSKLKDIIIKSTNLQTDKNLSEPSRGTAIVNIIPVWTVWQIYQKVVRIKNLLEFFV